MIQYIDYNRVKYPARWCDLYDEHLLIATETLERALLNNDMSNYTSNEARMIDESVYFYVPDTIIDSEDRLLYDYLRHATER